MTRVVNLTAAIATLNRPDGLAVCLDTLLEAEVAPAEVIIVDQSLNNDTRALVEQRQHGRQGIVYIQQQQRGLSASRNAAIRQATTPLIAFTDDDCVPDRGWIAAIERAFSSSPLPDAVTGRVLPLGPEVPGLFNVSPRESTIPTEFSGKVVPWVVGTGGNFAVQRKWFDRIGVYDERLGAGSPGKAAEDADLFYRLLRAGARIRYEPDVLVYHERQDKVRRLARRWSYGYGIGAFCAIWMRRRDLRALRILGYRLRDVCSTLAGALVRRDWLGAYQMWLALSGTVQGFVYGLRAR